jgi:hypothetical protein
MEVTLEATGSKAASEWLDLATSNRVGGDSSLTLKVAGNGFRALEFRKR